LLQKCSFAGARTRDQTHYANAGLLEAESQFASQKVVLLQYAFTHFNNTWASGGTDFTHGSISIRTTSNSCPAASSMTRLAPSAVVPSHAMPNENCRASLATPDNAPSCK